MRDFAGMSHSERRRLFERATFERFCDACELQIADGSLLQPDPPAPDIRATIVGEGTIAFELVCLDDDASQARLNLMGDAQALTRQHHHSLEPAARAAFDAAFGDAFLMIAFVSTKGKRGVRAALPGLFEALMRLPHGASGQVFADLVMPPAGIERVNIARDPSMSGPEFTTSTGGFVGQLNLPKLEEKITRTYQSDVPVDLLAYAAEVSRQSDDDRIREIVDQRAPGSGYRRIWIYEDLLRKATCHIRRS